MEVASNSSIAGLTYGRGSHGMCTTQKDEVNRDLLAFIKE